MSATVLRISHNGNVFVNNPHWTLGIGLDGKVIGEVLRYHTRYAVSEQLTGPEVQFIFQTADAMSRQFPPVEQHLNHHHDDVCIQGGEPGKVLYRYIVPPEEQRHESIAEFFTILNKVVDRYGS